MAVAAFFDLDRTLVDAATEKVLAARLRQAGILRWTDLARVAWSYLRYDQAAGDYEALKRRSVRMIMTGKPEKECSDLAAESMETLLPERLFPEARDRLCYHREAGHRVCIVSSALDLVVAPCAQMLRADAFFATALGRQAGEFTGAITGRIHAGPGKVDAVRTYAREQGVDLAASYAYGDHYDDRHMLSAVGHPVAVNPDTRLQAHAQQQGWTVARWQR